MIIEMIGKMRRVKRKILSSFILVLGLVAYLVILPFTVYADNDESVSFKFALRVNESTHATVFVGDEIDFQVEMKRTDAGRNGDYLLYSAQDEIIYDSRHFSYVEGSAITPPSYGFNIRIMEDGVRKKIILSRLVMSPEGAVTPDNLRITTFKLKALAVVEDEEVTSVNCKISSLPLGDSENIRANDVTVTVAGYRPTRSDISFIGNDAYYALPQGYKLMVLTVPAKPVGHTYEYDGNSMFHSSLYSKPLQGEFVYLYMVPDGLNAADAANSIQLVPGDSLELDYDKDINGDDRVNSTDAVLIYGLFKGLHLEDPEFKRVPMKMRLEADANGDQTVDTHDAAAVLYNLWNR